MNEAKLYADNFGAAFFEENGFLHFLKERTDGGWWRREESRDLHFLALDDESDESGDYINECMDNGTEDIMKDTMENTRLLLQAQDQCYPVRTCAIKSILERAKISGTALNKVEKPVLARILNYCMGVATGSALLRYSEGKISAVHGGDSSEYAILEMSELFEAMADYLNATYPGCQFAGASYDHSIATAVWEICQDEKGSSTPGKISPQRNFREWGGFHSVSDKNNPHSLIETYKEALEAHGIPYDTLKPALRLTSSDVGISGANIYPMLLSGRDEKIITLGSPLKLEHKTGANLEKFKSQLPMIYAQYTLAIGNLMNLLKIEINNPVNCFLGVCKKIGVTKKLAYDAATLFEGQNGNTPCTAHEIYYGISEVIFMMQCAGESGSRIAQMEENIARAFTVRWHDYDIPGEAKW